MSIFTVLNITAIIMHIKYFCATMCHAVSTQNEQWRNYFFSTFISLFLLQTLTQKLHASALWKFLMQNNYWKHQSTRSTPFWGF